MAPDPALLNRSEIELDVPPTAWIAKAWRLIGGGDLLRLFGVARPRRSVWEPVPLAGGLADLVGTGADCSRATGWKALACRRF